MSYKASLGYHPGYTYLAGDFKFICNPDHAVYKKYAIITWQSATDCRKTAAYPGKGAPGIGEA
jgi:hypothetical protein